MADQFVPYCEGMTTAPGLDTPSADAPTAAVYRPPASIPNVTSSIVQFELSQVSPDEEPGGRARSEDNCDQEET